MKKAVSILVICLFTSLASAQAPESFKYQSVVRDGTGSIIANQSVGFQISILQSSTGISVYTEQHNVTTNSFGLANLEIGTGTVVSGNFSTINWGVDIYFVQIELDATGGTNYQLMGTSQLLSVPYALHSKTAENITGTINETDPVFGASIAGGITATDTTNWNNHTVDTDTHIDSLGISNLGFDAGTHTVDTQIDSTGIASYGYVAGQHTIDTDTHIDSAEISNLGFITSFNEIDGDSTNELQLLSLSNDTLTLSGGNSVALASGISNGYGTMQVYKTSGVFLWTAPSGVTKVMVESWSGGGGGAGGYEGPISLTYSGCTGGCLTIIAPSGGAGGNGAYSKGIVTVTPGVTYTITIGAGGVGSLPNSNGTDGGVTSFSTLLNTSGGEGGSAGLATSLVSSSCTRTWNNQGGLGGLGGDGSSAPLYVNGGNGGNGGNAESKYVPSGCPTSGSVLTINTLVTSSSVTNIPNLPFSSPVGIALGGQGAQGGNYRFNAISGTTNINCQNASKGEDGQGGAMIMYY